MSGEPAYDAVVVGSGAGGGACAYGLTRRGLRVLLLEAGPRYEPKSDYRTHRSAWEQSPFPHKLSPRGRQTYAEMQRLDPGWKDLASWSRVKGALNPTQRRRVWGYSQVAGLGGTTLHFSGEAHRLHPESMRMRTRFGVAADWPLDYSELEPYYLQAEGLVGVAGPAADPTRWRSAPYPLPAHRASFASRRIGEGCRKLGLGWVPNPVAIPSAPYDGRPACNYCGQCGRGCWWLDKGSVDLTFIAKALSTGRCEVKTGCRVIRIEAGADDLVNGLLYADGDGRMHAAGGRVLVVACGAVETPRLLLASESSHAPLGLANESGQVGRNFMDTLAWNSSGLSGERLGSHRGLPADHICWDYNAPDAVPGVVGGCRFTPNMAELDLTGPIAYARRVVPGWGRGHKKRMRESFGRVLTVGAIGEHLPGPGGFVDLDPEARDRFGMPKARIHAQVGAEDLKRLRFMAETCRRILDAAGVSELIEEIGTYDLFNATHVFGTCRMGDDSDSSVVDRYCRSHQWRNLYIADASVFPSTGGGEAPSLTIEALALRAADHIADNALRDEL